MSIFEPKKSIFILGMTFVYKFVSKGGVILEIVVGSNNRIIDSLNIKEIDFDDLSILY